MRITRCGIRYGEFRVVSDVWGIPDAVGGWVGGLDKVAYIRVSLKSLNNYLDIVRCVASAGDAIKYLRSRVAKPYIANLIGYLRSRGIDTCLEVVLCELGEELSSDPYIGDLYLGYCITPVSNILTYVRLKQYGSLVLDEVRFNVCALREGLKVVGCVLVDEGVLDVGVVNDVLEALARVTDCVGRRLRYVTWLLNSDYLKVVDVSPLVDLTSLNAVS